MTPADNTVVRLVATRRLDEDMVIARDVLTGRHGGVPLLRRGSRISDRYIRALERAGINAVYIDDAVSEGITITPALTEETRQHATSVLEKSLSSVRTSKEGRMSLPEGAIAELTSLARLLASELAHCDDAIVALQDLAAADAYTMQHSIDVTAIGLLLGRRLMKDAGWIDYRADRRFDRIDERVVQLGLGLILHDIGKLTVPQDIIAKQGPLDEYEWQIVRGHPMAGIDLVSQTQLSAVARTVIRSHHERWDGSGYPDKISGDAIHQYARIAAIADVYDAVTSERPYSASRAPHIGWKIVVDGAGTLFDREAVAAFRRVVAPYPPGAEITLPDGSTGIVVSVEPATPERPLVRVAWDPTGTPITPHEFVLDKLPSPALARAA